MMKTVIIGGGVAGLSLAIAMRNAGYVVTVCERDERSSSNGHAFLIHPDAMAVLERVVETDPYHLMPGRTIDRLLLKNADDDVLDDMALDGWVCMKRCEAMQALASQLPPEVIQYGRSFSHFIFENEKAVAVVFANGDIEYGDWFIGCDGARSAVRQALFGPTDYTPVLVKEILGTIDKRELLERNPHMFTKYLSRDKGLAIGFIPCSDVELIWFLQFDVNLCQTSINTQEEIAAFCKEVVREFPEEVKQIMECKSVVANYVWNTTDFELLPTFHDRNVLLIGDAAHVALPFTSAGVANALLDVNCFMQALGETTDFETICKTMYITRGPHLKNHVAMGREIRASFLQGSDKSVKLPLIKDMAVLAD